MFRPFVLLIAALVAGCATPFDLQGHRGTRRRSRRCTSRCSRNSWTLFDVDGIIGDRPDVVREEMRKRGMALPAAR